MLLQRARQLTSKRSLYTAAALSPRHCWGGARQFWNGAATSPPPPATSEDGKVMMPLDETRKLLYAACRGIGYSAEDAAVMQECMMWAQIRDNNQGIIKVTSGGVNPSPTAGIPIVENDSPSGARVNGNHAMSMVVLHKGVTLAKQKALSNGCAVVGTYNTSQSMGAVGFYASMLAEAGLVGIIMATSPEYVAPHGAKQPIFGTNPICCAVPTSRGLMLMDQATAAFAWFGLLEAKTAGRKIPNDIAWDKNGNQTDDPSEALQGALRTFDRGYKSSNLAMMVELIAGPLVGGAHTNKLAAKNWGNLVIAIHPGMLGDADAFYKNAGEVLDRVRTAERLPGVSEMVIPGEKESTLAAQRLKDGALPIEKNMLEELRQMAAKFTGDYPAELAAGGSAAAVGGGQEEILAKLLMKLDNLEQQVGATATAQQKLEAMLRK
jgi:LDH2 family malate/lactate/ureidoglycolate dehydrogenase